MKAFHDENPTHALVQSLSRGAFDRGLPRATDLSAQPDVAALFRNLLTNGFIVERKKMKQFASAITMGGSMPTQLRMRTLCATHFHPLSTPYVSPEGLNLRTTCPLSLPSSIWHSMLSPSSNLPSYSSQSAVLDLCPWTSFPKRNTRMSSIVLSFLSLMGMFVSPLSLHLQRGHVLQVASTSSFQQ